MIIPYAANSQLHGDSLFVRLRILCEGGQTPWTEELNRDDVEEILRDSDLTDAQLKGTGQDGSDLFYKVGDTDAIPEWTEMEPGNQDLCWRTFCLVLRKSAPNPDKYFFYLPCPSAARLGNIYLEELFEYILKVEFDIDIEL